MCEFFSFVSTGDGRFLYFDVDQRSHAHLTQSYLSDSHSSLAAYYLNSAAADDRMNKYEYRDGQLIVDQVNVKDDSKQAGRWIKKFVITKEFEQLCLAAVQQDGWALEYIKEQTPEICLAAVQQTWRALRYVKEQTPEICLAAVQQNGLALQYIKEQTPELCLAAVQQNGLALQYIKEQTPEICLAAVQQDGWALRYAKEQTPDLRLAAKR